MFQITHKNDLKKNERVLFEIKKVAKRKDKRFKDDGYFFCSYDYDEEDKNALEYFCIEDTFFSTDINASVKGIGKLEFPLTESTVKKIIEVSSKSKFRKIRKYSVIPADQLEVTVNENSFNDVLQRYTNGLNIASSNMLTTSLSKMVIYGPEQFIESKKNDLEVPNMVGSLVIVLPYPHKGGDVIIKYKDNRRIFFGSKNSNFVKCVAFYPDCENEVLKVTEGYCVTLIYNIIFNTTLSKSIGIKVNEDQELIDSFKTYFSEKTIIVYLLNHDYPENHLKWEMLKGSDRVFASIMFEVANLQNLIPCLALSEYRELIEERLNWVVQSDTKLYFWVDQHNCKITKKKKLLAEDEICCTKKTTKIFEPFKAEHGIYKKNGKKLQLVQKYYRRACIVFLSNEYNSDDGSLDNANQDSSDDADEDSSDDADDDSDNEDNDSSNSDIQDSSDVDSME